MKTILLMFSYLSLMLLGQVVWKKGLQQIPDAFNGSLLQALNQLGTSSYILSGLLMYGIATFLWLYLLSKHELSYIYPMNSASFILGVLVAFLLLGESVPLNRWAGVMIISLGVYLVSIK